MRTFSIDHILATSWERKIAADLVAEIEACIGEKQSSLEEMRRFLAIKGYRELFERLKVAGEGKRGEQALKAIAEAMRLYTLARPALSAAAFRTPTGDSPEWRSLHQEMQAFMLNVFAECGLFGKGADRALQILRSLVRGFVLHEMMGSLSDVDSYSESYESALQVFISGLPALASLT